MGNILAVRSSWVSLGEMTGEIYIRYALDLIDEKVEIGPK